MVLYCIITPMKKRRKTKRKINRMGNNPCPICEERHILVEHHIEGRNIPNPNHSSNLAYVCSCCHRELHEGIVIIEGYFQTSNGLQLIWHFKDEEGLTGEESKPYLIP